MSQLIIELKIEGRWQRATGTDTYSFLTGLGYNPWTMREQGITIEDFRWIKTADGWVEEHKPVEKPREKRISTKEQKRLERKLAAYLKE